MSYVCEAVYLGQRNVQGAQSAASIGGLVEEIVNRSQGDPGQSHQYPKVWAGVRVQLQLDEERLRVVPVKKDEGFESDSEGSSGSLCGDACCSSDEVKVIRDHVLRLDKLLRQESDRSETNSDSLNTSTTIDSGASSDGSSGEGTKLPSEDGTQSSSGAESEDDTSPRLQRCLPPNNDSPSSSTSDVSTASTHPKPIPASSSDVNPGVDIFLMSDILFCHICGPYPTVVVIVVKVSVPGSLLRAHVLECVTQQTAKTLYSHYYKASNQYKLNRYRNSKRKTEARKDSTFVASIFEDNSDVFNSLRSCAVRKDSGTSSISENESVRGSIRSIRNNTDSGLDKNINVIEVKSTENNDDSKPYSLVQHTDNDGITHIEIESGPVSLLNGGSVSSDFSSIISLSTPENVNINNSVNSIKHTKNRNYSTKLNSPYSSFTTNDEDNSSALEKEKKFRQRQPAMLIRDNGETFDQKLAKKSTEDQHEYRSRKERYVVDHTKSRELGRPPLPVPSSPWVISERPSRPRDISRSRNQTTRDSKDRDRRDDRDYREKEFIREKEQRDREQRAKDLSNRNYRNKPSKSQGPPLPPPRKHPHDSSLLLVPTKSGHEPKRSYYPKESHIVRGNKVVRVDFPTVPVWGPRSDSNNNPRQYMHYTGGWAHEFHAPRIREPIINSEIRRRSRSKSPAKRQITNRYLDAVTTFNISQKLREISDAVFSTKKSHSNNIVNSLPPIASHRSNRIGSHRTGSTGSIPGDNEPLRSVIKKSKPKPGDSDNRRVTFSAYATVQLLDS